MKSNRHRLISKKIHLKLDLFLYWLFLFPLSLSHSKMPLKYWHIKNFLPKHLRTWFYQKRKDWKQFTVVPGEKATAGASAPWTRVPRGLWSAGSRQFVMALIPCSPLPLLTCLMFTLAFHHFPFTTARCAKAYSLQKREKEEKKKEKQPPNNLKW